MAKEFIPYEIIVSAVVCLGLSTAAHAEIDGHGPDAWQVRGVASNDVLNARMGPGTDYSIIETFAHDARGLHQVTCVPYFTMAHYINMTDAEYKALPSPWCLMRSADLSKAGWVSQRYLAADGYIPVDSPTVGSDAVSSDQLISHAQDLVRALYEAHYFADKGGPQPLSPENAANYFTTEVAAALHAQPLGADPLYGAQDFNGSVDEPQPDPENPMLRGTITLNVDITNFGQTHTAVFYLRADPGQPGAPIRIFRIEHGDWSFP
ncbi:hypothetical protein J3456_18845 [Sulfitobacter sp. NFXS29]|uniref:hypothetical protein n=1 Tax=Sulfitobacter sp. NFXS29 TaxID=2818438 RepID=UPI0032DF922C